MSSASLSSPSRLLCLSNGHGEDQIAVRILQALQTQPQAPEMVAMPMVGNGHAYQNAGIPLIGPSKTLPSGGFIYMDGRQLAKDVQGGLLGLLGEQWRAVRQWRDGGQGSSNNRGRPGGALILAVGDIVPLLLGWFSGVPYAFVGTAKSDYYLRDEIGPLKRQGVMAKLESRSPSVYLPWERWLMSRSRCRAVFPRDRLTAQTLKRWKIPVFDLGNPMMDGLEPEHPEVLQYPFERDSLKLLLLPGSRPPEVYRNWELVLEAVKALVHQQRSPWDLGGADRPLVFLGAMTPGLDLEALTQTVQIQGWLPLSDEGDRFGPLLPEGARVFGRRQHRLLLSQQSYGDYLQLADGAIAMAGTATEQFVGLGKPAIIIPGQGPQFTAAFAEAQTRLLGSSVLLVEQPSRVPERLDALMQNPDWLRAIAENGKRRMGEPGAARRIAKELLTPRVQTLG